MTDQEELRALRGQLFTAEAQRKILVQRVAELDLALTTAKADLEALRGSGYSFHRKPGTIGVLKDKIAALEGEIEDRTKPVVVWLVEPSWSVNRIVEKVTPKRIYTKTIGSDRCDLFNRDGTTVGRGCGEIIDIEKTFPVKVCRCDLCDCFGQGSCTKHANSCEHCNSGLPPGDCEWLQDI